MARTSFPKHRIKVLLLEGVHPIAAEAFSGETFQVETLAGSLAEPELARRIDDVHLLGVRSKTRLSETTLAASRRLLAVGAFCIGTDRIALDAAAGLGVPVFNAPFSNTRSVAELVIAHCVSLLRGVPARNRAAHEGRWLKSAEGSHEARGKTLGIVGYGHIGSQVSVLAEALGMRVIYHDIVDKLALGNAAPVRSLGELLARADVVTLHVPATPQTAGLLDRRALRRMKQGSHLINYSRGNVVDLDALAAELRAGRLSGAAIDVFPAEPTAGDAFQSPLQNMDNVILTPHIGGSTLEAQQAIGREVAQKLIKFVNNGSTTSAVNVPEVELPVHQGMHRILHFHRNVPGVLQQVNALFAQRGINVLGQYLMTDSHIGYLVMDVSRTAGRSILDGLNRVPGTIRSRILY
jgi:D-3-phosphoglycerate dehydrogenase / 2-oxoglutarate reductase